LSRRPPRLLQNSLSTGDSPGQVSVSITAVPEPATWAMMILGFLRNGRRCLLAEQQRRRSTTPDDQSFLNPRGRLFGTAFVLVHDKAQRTTTGTADLGPELTLGSSLPSH
jgi:hypothetical protein